MIQHWFFTLKSRRKTPAVSAFYSEMPAEVVSPLVFVKAEQPEKPTISEEYKSVCQSEETISDILRTFTSV